MKIFTLLFLLFGISSAAFSQPTGSVSGIVLFEGKPVEGAEVRLAEGRDFSKAAGTQTDSAGRFRFERVRPGTYGILGFSRIEMTTGQYAQSVLDVQVAAGTDIYLTLNLEVTQTSAIHRVKERVEISADSSQPIDEVSKTVSVITGQEMRDRADFTLIDTLRTIPGFRVQQLGGFGRTASIKTRGLRNQDTAVLIDGIRFRDPGSITGDATPFLSDFTLTSVERIEVLRGPGSSLYGTNAAGGTLDFQTPSAREGVHGQISGAAGGLGLGRFRGNLSYGTEDRKFGITGAASRTAYTKGIDGEDNASNTNFQSRVDYQPFPKTNLSGRFFVSDARVRLNTSPDTFGSLPSASTIIDAREGVNFTPDVNDPDSIQNSRFFSGQFAVSQIINSELLVSGYYQGLVTKRTNEDGPLGVGFQSAFTSRFGGTIHTANIHATWTPAPLQILTGGYEFETEGFQNSGTSGTDVFSTQAGQRSNTFYVQHLAGFFNGGLQLAGGARAQWFNLTRPEFSTPTGPYLDLTLSNPPAAYTFDASASYFIARSETKLRLHVGNGYRVPSLYERFGTFFFGAFFQQGNPGLKPERSLGIDAGIDQYFAEERVKVSATYFYTRIKDEITYLPVDFSSFAYFNFDRHYSRGAEFSVDARPTKATDIFASYTFTNSDIRNFSRPTFGTLASSDRKAFGIPDHQFTLVVTQRIKRFWVSLDLLATGSYLAPVFSSSTFSQYTYRFGGNRRADLTAGYTFPIRRDKFSLRLFGTIENLFDHEYFENGFRTVGRNARVGLSLGF